MNPSRPFGRIVVPLDGSQLAESILPLVATLARCLGATVVLLHVVEAHAPRAVHGDRHLRSVAEAESYLRSVAASLGGGFAVEQYVRGPEEHRVAGSIAQRAGELGAGLIALCIHGPADPRRFLAGSVGQRVAQMGTVPVLLLRATTPVPAQIKVLLVPLDGTPFAETALPGAISLARACGARIHLLRVVPTVGTLTGEQIAAARLGPMTTAAALDAEEDEACTYLLAQVQQLALAGVNARAEVCRGAAARQIADAASRAGADLIVMATHGRAGFDAYWIGSVAADLVGRARQPLLLFRAAGQ
jgi:nucleotide-binding universal stress UspA family protein